MERIRLWLWLTLKNGISSPKISSLLEKFDSIEDIYRAKKTDFINIPKIFDKDAEILSDKSLKRAEEVIDECRSKGIRILTMDSPYYPENLRHIFDPPYVLYVRCKEKLNLNESLCITVVGTRRPTNYGILVTGELSEELAREGFTIVSGMARGIDSIALSAALSANARVVAVLGCGVDVVYPIENKNLYDAIIENGIVLSEFPPKTPPLKENFPQRNRIMSALSRATLVTEAPARSGALITASYAFEQNREVYAVPGNITSKSSKGCNILISQLGAKAVIDADSIIVDFRDCYAEVLRKNKPIIKERTDNKNFVSYNEKYKDLSEKERLIMKTMSPVPIHIDTIIEKTKLSAEDLTSELTVLEIAGMIKSHPGMMFSLNI
ncbi:MAG: DNA-protecting protein DprA [Ruminococcaceae bacterium]|nr:DNA-protecting protein DprA [Oscillospiraceae bacterium]